MRRYEREMADKAELEAVLAKATVVHLAMVDEGRPYVVPMNFGYADGCLYLHGAKEGRKMRILRRNPAVCFNLFTDEAILPGPGPAGCISPAATAASPARDAWNSSTPTMPGAAAWTSSWRTTPPDHSATGRKCTQGRASSE